MDAQPPAIVWEGRPACAASDRSEALLRRGLSSSTAPGEMWVVNVHLEVAARHLVTAESQIADDDGIIVAQRTLTGLDCDGIARAMGVWASLVLDSEMARAFSDESKARPEPRAAKEAEDTPPPWPAPAPFEPAPPEADWYLHHDEKKSLEIGAATLVMSGAAGGLAMIGFSPFAVVEVGEGFYLRPSLVFGEGVGANGSAPQLGAGRVDGCIRMPGLYTEHRGMQLDACLGSDLGVTHLEGADASTSLPYGSIGPSLELRGELASAASVALRGIVGLNYLSTSNLPPDLAQGLWSSRLELAFSWAIR